MNLEKILPKNEHVSDIEKTANYEGSHTLLLWERIHNPVIKQRLLNNFYEHLSTLDKTAFLQANNYERTLRQAERARKNFIENLTIDKIEKDFDLLARDVFNSTEINYETNPSQPASSGKLGSTGTVYVLATNEDGTRFSVNQLSAFEAHEKGHGIRMFYGDSDFTRRVANAFDFTAITKETADQYREMVMGLRKNTLSKNTADPLKYFESTHEIFERMGQLKNYFGMNADQVFTKDHLEYIRKHYIQYIGFKLQILPFLEAITNEKEDLFIELMNSLGV